MAKSRLSMALPKVGDHLKCLTVECEVEDCVVTYVNQSHGWYEVLFPRYNLRECYKPPTFDHAILQGNSPNDIPIICIETGLVYPSIYECSEDMELNRTSIIRQLKGDYSHCSGYHFINAL